MKKCLLIIVYIICCCVGAFAQQRGYSISGNIVDQEGAPVKGASIRIENTNHGAHSDDNGNYIIKGLKKGSYPLFISVIGYKPVSTQVTLTDNSVDALRFVLEPDINSLEEIQITDKQGIVNGHVSSGLRLDEPLVKIPQNIQVVSAALINRQMVFNIDDGLERNVSGVRFLKHHATYASVYMRGFDSRAGSARNGMNVAGYLAPLKEDMSFVDRVEFVKGPAGFMLGNTSPGGFYNVVTKKPTGSGQKRIAFTTGSYDLYRGEIDIDETLSKDGRWQYRLNLMGKKVNSFVDYDSNDGYVIAPSLAYQVSNNTRVTVEYTYQYSTLGTNLSNYIFSNKAFKEFPRNTSYSDPRKDPVKIHDHSAFVELEHKLSSDWKVTAKLAYLSFSMRGEHLGLDYRKAPYNNIDSAGNAMRRFSLLDLDNVTALGQLYFNGSFRTGVVQHRVLTGLDVKSNQYWADWSNIDDPKTITPFNIYKPEQNAANLKAENFPKVDRSVSLKNRAGANTQLNSSLAVYLADEIGFFDDKLRLTLGGRYTSTRRREYNGKTTNNDVFTPRVGLSYSFLKDASIYAVYDQTFEENYAPPLQNGDPAKPSRGVNMEIGAKADWFGGRFNTTLSVFNIVKNNITTQSPAGVTPRYAIQIGEVRSRGVELDVKGELLPSFDMVLNYAFNDARVTKDATPKNIGDYMPGSVKHTFNSWFTYRAPKGKIRGLGISAGHQLQADRVGYYLGGANFLPDSYFSLDGGLSYVKNNYGISLLVYNLTDNYNYTTGFFPGAWGYTHLGWQAAPGRNFRLQIEYKF
ncbi:MAG TPA: TonB-dependent receptor [Chitinophaga sp.]|uniref:TonB-dependent receptor n=1 Tax=Chitinophaga sp. TaxID=1869181 RepID=UPI002C937531|nr:TonB-dependent receptor [Chitinophaga sp.]HVI46119.1 TonB-dependent receptor [Chitinophaga sp.]